MENSEPVKKKSKKRFYNVQWEKQYGLVEFDDNTAFCVLCEPSKPFTHFLKSNHENHYLTFHGEYTKKTEIERISIINMKKAMLTYEVSERIDRSVSTATRISFLMAREIAREMLPFEHGESLKNIVSKFTNELFNTCPKLQSEVNEAILNVPLSRKVITKKIKLMSNDIYSQIDEDLKKCDCFSFQLDESTDVTDIAQVIVFIRIVFPDLTVKEECFGLFSLHDRATAEELFNHFKILIESRNVPLNKLVSMTSDGAAAMAGSENGFLAKCRNNKQFPCFNVYHCIIHQQVLCAKALNIDKVIEEVVTIINFIRGRALNHRQFKELIKEMDEKSELSDIIYYTEVRWLSKANMLERFASLLPVIREFLLKKEKNEWVEKLHNFEWLSLLMYAVDLTLIINTTNRKLQGKNKIVWDQIEVIRDLEITLTNIIKFCEMNIIDERLQRLKKLYSETSKETFCGEILIKATLPIVEEMKKRFKDFKDIEIISEIFVNPFALKFEHYNLFIETTRRLFPDAEWINYSDLINEFQSLPRDKKIMAMIASGGDMWKSIIQSEHYPNFLGIYKRVLSVFSSTYLSESGFSFMKKIKTSERSRLTDENLGHLMNLKTSSREPDICELMSKMQCQKSHNTLGDMSVDSDVDVDN